jgi:hypothetical protein
MMNRRFRSLGVALTLVGSVPALAGCETWRNSLRKPDHDPSAASEIDTSKIHDVQTPGKPFFKSSRLPGAMSDEGREIESDLGIH